MHYFDMNESIIWWASEEVIVPYRDPFGKVRRYFPDFIIRVKQKDKTTKTIMIEVKPEYQKNPPKKQTRKTQKYINEVVTYAINPGSLYRFYTDYDMSNHDLYRSGQIQLMSNYIGRLIASAVNQSVDEFPALEVNSSLDRIQEVIKTNLQGQLAKNNLDTGIQVESVVAVKADLPDTLVESVNRVVAAQSDKKEKTVRNETILLTQQTKTDAAKLKAEENKALESSITPRYLEYQRNEIMKEAFSNGDIEKMIIVNGSPLEMLPTGKIGN